MSRTSIVDLTIKYIKISRVEQFKYLGSVSVNASNKNDVKKNLSQSRAIGT